MTEPNLIVVDIDSTLFDFIRAFAHVSDRDHGIACGLKPDEWNALIVDFADPALAIATFPRAYDHDMVEFNQPYEGAQDGVQGLKNLGYRIAYYTDRPQESVAATKEWLDRYDFPEGELHVCSDKRAELMKRKDEIATIIDDRPRTLIWGRYELGLDEVFSLRHGYNRNLIDIPGVNLFDSWAGMLMAIELTLGGVPLRSAGLIYTPLYRWADGTWRPQRPPQAPKPASPETPLPTPPKEAGNSNDSARRRAHA